MMRTARALSVGHLGSEKNKAAYELRRLENVLTVGGLLTTLVTRDVLGMSMKTKDNDDARFGD